MYPLQLEHSCFSIKGTAFLSDRQEGLLRDVLKSEVMPEDTAATTNTGGQN